MTEKKILSAIPVGETLYKAGTEDALNEVLTPDQVKYLIGQNAIEGGFGKPLIKTKPETEDKPTDLSKMKKTELAAHAESVGVKVTSDSMTNKQIIEAIEAGK